MKIPLALGAILTLLLVGAASGGPRVLVDQGKSAYTIVHDAQAPASVRRAAQELSRVVAVATGVKLPIQTTPASPMICLGINDSSRAAGLDKDLPEVGFRLATRDQDLFILGRDSADKEPKMDQPRLGTFWGACDFLERVVNVRWLFPADFGEDVPKAGKLVIPDLDVREAPPIRCRWLIGVKDRNPDVNLWKMRNKTDVRENGIGVSWGHSFHRVPPDEVRRVHPEFMAMRKDGTRAPVPAATAPHVMYCLSNPALVDAFAGCVLEQFEKSTRLIGTSISPDEGAAWCECPDCRKVAMPIDARWKDLGVVNNPQRTPVVLNFYNEVARRVAAKYPDRILGGMIYQDYLLPLEKPIRMEPNLLLGIAINAGYGFKFYQTRRAEMVQQYFDEWAKYGVPLGYYDYSTWMRNWFGVPLPPGRSLLKWLFPMIRRNKVEILQYVGMEAWGYSAVQNYIVSKLMWNPQADVDALYSEFLLRAYGAEAAPLIDRMTTLVDDRLKEYIQSVKYPDHEIDYAAAKGIYGSIYPEIERLYLEALGKTSSELHRRRLELLGENLVVANFNLRKCGLLPEDDARKSPLYRSDDELREFVQQKQSGIGMIAVAEWVKTYGYPEMPVLKVGWRPR